MNLKSDEIRFYLSSKLKLIVALFQNSIEGARGPLRFLSHLILRSFTLHANSYEDQCCIISNTVTQILWLLYMH